MCDSLRSTPLTRFILLYAAMYAAFGVASPFLPTFVSAQGVPPAQLGLVLGAGTAVRWFCRNFSLDRDSVMLLP